MSKEQSRQPGWGKILDAWIPPEDAGEPIGCVATSFTFSPVLFEEECLSRFLQLETDATEDGPAYLVEREEKLSQCYAAALVDQHHARGVRSLRWDLLPARLPRGILHAKVSLLLWSRCARLIVASANLTEDGYRRNHEVFGALDYLDGSDAPLPVLDEVVALLREAVGYASPLASMSSPAITRWNGFLDHVSTATRNWGSAEAPRRLNTPRAFAVLTGPARPSAFATLRERWPDNGPPDSAFVVSPFFDPPEAPNEPAKQLWTLLKQRGDASVEFQVTAEEVPGEKAILLHAPKTVLDAEPSSRSGTETIISRLKLEDGRPLHAKCLWLQNDRVVLHMIGSSNFTSAGMGVGKAQNLEANLAFTVSQQNKAASKAFENAWLPAEEIPDDLERRWLPRRDEGEDSALANLPPLPKEFDQATYGCDKQQRGFVEFTFNGTPPAGWTLFAEDDREPFLRENAWQVQDSQTQLRLLWTRDRAPSGFRVSWAAAEGCAWWPVNVLASDALPPPAELRNLPLEVLIEILTSAKPLHQALQRWLRRQEDGQRHDDGPILDPHKRVDTSAFLLQRTRRVSDALTDLRHRLERSFATEQSLGWRLRGPVGVMALAQAIGKEARSEQERSFLLTELCLELARVKPQTLPGSLAAKRVRTALREIAQEIRATISQDALANFPALAAYMKAAFEEVTK